MANIPLPSNIVFTRSGDSLFENVTIWGNTNLNTLNVYGESLFYENVTFKKAVVDVKQYSDSNTPRTEYGCSNPIEVTVSDGITTIEIGSTSNAHGKKYIQTTEPTTDVCDGDIWYDTTPVFGDWLQTGIQEPGSTNNGSQSGTAATMYNYYTMVNIYKEG